MWRVCNMHLCVEYTVHTLLTQWPKFANQKQAKHAHFDPLSKILRKYVPNSSYYGIPDEKFIKNSSFAETPFFFLMRGGGGG